MTTSINNPPPVGWHGATVRVERHGDCLWNIAKRQVLQQHPKLSGNALTTATARELSAIEKVNPQIKNDDLIYVGDIIAIPGHPSAQPQGNTQPPNIQGSTAGKLAATQTAADKKNQPQVKQLVASYAGKYIPHALQRLLRL